VATSAAGQIAIVLKVTRRPSASRVLASYRSSASTMTRRRFSWLRTIACIYVSEPRTRYSSPMATTRITTTANTTFQYTISPPAWSATLHGTFDRSLEGSVWVYVAGGDRRHDRRGASADPIVTKQTAAVPLDRALGHTKDERDVTC